MGFDQRVWADWECIHISTKLYMVLHTYCDSDPTKVIEESKAKCGFEAYRLLSKMYDPHNVDTEFALTNNLLQISTWSVTGIEQAGWMKREANARKSAWETRTKNDIVPGVMIVINTMLYGKLDPGIKQDVTSVGGGKAREDFILTKRAVEGLK